jgi:hypothetical protein
VKKSFIVELDIRGCHGYRWMQWCNADSFGPDAADMRSNGACGETETWIVKARNGESALGKAERAIKRAGFSGEIAVSSVSLSPR